MVKTARVPTFTRSANRRIAHRRTTCALLGVVAFMMVSCRKAEDVGGDSATASSTAVSRGMADSAQRATASATTPATTPANGAIPGTRESTASRPAANPPGSLPAIPDGDTLRGIVQRVGNDPVSVFVLTASSGTARSVHALHGDQRGLLVNVVGLEIVVRGTLTNARDMQAAPRGAEIFRVRQFEVRAAEGVPAIDGILTLKDQSYALRTQAGRNVALPHVPSELRSQVGQRVFIVGPVQQPAVAFGLISPTP